MSDAPPELARRLEALEAEVRQLRRVQECTAALISSLDLSETLDTILRTALDVAGARQGSVLLYETRLNRLLPRARRPYAAELAAGAAFAVDAVEGSVFLARREAWEAVGGFDDRYFFGFEDMDLGWRLRRAGWQTWHDPAPAAVHHHAGASGGTRSASTLLLVSVGLGAMYFMRKNRPASYAALWPPLVAAFSVKWALTRLLGRRAHATAFRETVRAMLGLRPMWIVPEDRRRWT